MQSTLNFAVLSLSENFNPSCSLKIAIVLEVGSVHVHLKSQPFSPGSHVISIITLLVHASWNSFVNYCLRTLLSQRNHLLCLILSRGGMVSSNVFLVFVLVWFCWVFFKSKHLYQKM